MSKHRRVKSLVRELESNEVVTGTGSGSGTASAGGAPAATGLGASTTASGIRPPSLHTRASSSSIASLASQHSATSPSSNGGFLSASSVPPPSIARKSSSTSLRSNHSGRSTPHLSPQQYRHSSSSFDSSSYPHSHRASVVFDEGLTYPMTSQTSTTSQDDEEDEERDEVFLPINSPFTPNYSMSASAASSPRRDSGGPPPSSSSSSSSPAPPSLSTMTAAERREHSRRHSRVHSRNLSIFFPRPEQRGLPGYAEIAPEDDVGPEGRAGDVSVDIPGAQTKGWGFANGAAGATPFRPAGSGAGAAGGEEGGAQTQASSRRGHHHRHSMSHNFFPFIEQSSRRTSNSSLSAPQQGDTISPTSPLATGSGLHTPRSVPALSASTSRHRKSGSDSTLIPTINLRTKYSHFPSPIRFILAFALHLPILTQAALLASFAEIMLGASLWIAGQSGESLAVTALGYLVVFDGLGAISSVMMEGNARGVDRLWSIMQGRSSAENEVRYPFGTARSITLSHFAQCVYLIFSAVYVCKESIEHVLLLHGPDEGGADGHVGDASHGATHGTMGHGQAMADVASAGSGSVFEWEDMGVLIPTKLMVFSLVACIFTAIALQNHASLTEAVGPSTYSLRPRMPNNNPKTRISTLINNSIFSNPFTLTVMVFSSSLAIASLLIPAQQLAPLDKVVALLQSIAMFYIAYPAAIATGKALLQTAPPTYEYGGAMNNLRRVLEEIENHSSVVYLPPPHIWQLTPHPPPVLQAPSLKSSAFGRKSLPIVTSSSKEPTVTVVTLNVQVRQETSDQEILELTTWCREKCLLALVGSSRASSGDSKSGGSGSNSDLRQAELTVQVVRFEEARALQAETDRQPQHSHSHSHSHSHGHSHDAGSHGSVSHGHDHGHSHSAETVGSHDHSSHSDSHGHGHSHHAAAQTSHSHDHGSHVGHGHHH